MKSRQILSLPHSHSISRDSQESIREIDFRCITELPQNRKLGNCRGKEIEKVSGKSGKSKGIL